MDHDFDQAYWDEHWWQVRNGSGARPDLPPNPHLVREVGGLAPGTALEAGCGEGAEAIWLAQAGWTVTAADIADEVLARASGRAGALGLVGKVRWVRADLGSWVPEDRFDLVTTHYAHPVMPQLDFYDRLAGWVAPGGTLLVVGHLLPAPAATGGAGHGHGHGHGHGEGQPPAKASATAETITARLDPATWDVVTAEARTRTVGAPGGSGQTLNDVVVRAVRRRVADAGS